MLKCIELDERLKAMDQEITVNPQFVQKVTARVQFGLLACVLSKPILKWSIWEMLHFISPRALHNPA